jgi:hypothetical protein
VLRRRGLRNVLRRSPAANASASASFVERVCLGGEPTRDRHYGISQDLSVRRTSGPYNHATVAVTPFVDGAHATPVTIVLSGLAGMKT